MTNWSKKHEACVECGTTERKHSAHGLCSRCNARRDYRKNPVRRTQSNKRAKRWKMRNESRCRGYQKQYQAANIDKRRETWRRQYAVRKASGYTAEIVRGDMVTADYLLKAYRMGSKYVLDGECVVNLLDESGKVAHEGVPLSSLRAAPSSLRMVEG